MSFVFRDLHSSNRAVLTMRNPLHLPAFSKSRATRLRSSGGVLSSIWDSRRC